MQKTHDIPLVGGVLRAMFGARNERLVKRYNQRVAQINALEPQTRALTDAQLKGKTREFRERVKTGAKADDLLVEAFAVAREAMDRAVGVRNIFHPELRDEFDASRLPQSVRTLYEKTRDAMDALEPAQPVDEYLGCAEPTPGWLQLDIPNELYDAVRELYPESRPPFRARPFDVQLIGGMVLYQGRIAEMKTGEGKTIVAPLACYLASLEGLLCHVVTVNDYLVQRDRDWVFPFFRALGLTVGAIHPQHMQPEPVKRLMYQCDVLYGTTSEFGFDYLRDNMKLSVEQQVQRGREFAIVDEVDSILIDEARTPLIISGPAHEDSPRYELADRLAQHLVEKQREWNAADEKVLACKKRIKGIEGDIRNARDKSKVPALQATLKQARAELPRLEADRDRFTQFYEVEMDRKQSHLTHKGVQEAQNAAGVGSLYSGENIDLPHLLEQAIRAHAVYQRDRDYVVIPLDDPHTGVKQPSIVIVDAFTGRLQIGRQWSDGLHQAIEAKEKVPIKQETQTVATVTIQNYYRMYQRLAGMTGTADTEAQEFHDIYSLDVVVIPTNKPVIRRDFDDLVFLSEKDKWDAIVDEIKNFHDAGRPVLVGTTSVEKSEMLADMLAKRHNIKHEILNAKQHEREAHIIENAGQLGALMIATNMAGRGTDIKLGRVTREQLLEHWRKRGLAPASLTTDASDDEVRQAIYRKIAPKALGLPKREIEDMAFADIEMALLRAWAMEYTWIDPRRIERENNAEALRQWLDDHGRLFLHRVGWVETIEQLGGLHVVGTERHESRRIDNQLRGRSGRQGDRGSTRFFVSLEDDLMKMFAGETTLRILSRLGMKEGDAIEHPMLTKSVERAQRKVEERNFQIRKQILDYDEVMEHQRQDFYGLRQRVLEGRNTRRIIFNYIEEAIWDAVERYLGKGYAAERVAERAQQLLGCFIPAERLRTKDYDDLVERVQELALSDARATIDVSLGEHIPDDAEPEDYDLTGLANWAASQYSVELAPHELRDMDRRQIAERLLAAAEKRIHGADLADIKPLLDPDLGARDLASWAKGKFGFEAPLEKIKEAEAPEDAANLILEKARELHDQREVEQPVDYALATTMSLMRQSPRDAAGRLAAWAKARYNLDWDERTIMLTPPQKIRQQLIEASRAYIESGKIEQEVQDALAIADDDDALDAHLQERFGGPLPERVRRLSGARREESLRALVEGVVREEMVRFERFVLLETLDPLWKDHLYAMDQLRDSINFRAFSQMDPRIEFKREGSRLFDQMREQARDRVSEYTFRLRYAPALSPMAPSRQAPAAEAQPGVAPPLPAHAGAADGAAGAGAQAPPIDQPRNVYAGAQPVAQPEAAPATGVAPAARSPAGPPAAAQQTQAPAGDRQPAPSPRRSAPKPPARELVATRLAGSSVSADPEQSQQGATAPARQPAQPRERKVGRNDPCPCGSGKKYKKCCMLSEGGG